MYFRITAVYHSTLAQKNTTVNLKSCIDYALKQHSSKQSLITYSRALKNQTAKHSSLLRFSASSSQSFSRGAALKTVWARDPSSSDLIRELSWSKLDHLAGGEIINLKQSNWQTLFRNWRSKGKNNIELQITQVIFSYFMPWTVNINENTVMFEGTLDRSKRACCGSIAKKMLPNWKSYSTEKPVVRRKLPWRSQRFSWNVARTGYQRGMNLSFPELSDEEWSSAAKTE